MEPKMEDVMDEHVGQVIRRRRGEMGLTQEQLAENAGIAPTSIVRLENGEIERPRAATLTKVAGALGLPSGELARFVGTVHRPAVGDTDAGAPFTAVYERDGDWWIGYIEELPGANAQERTLEEARQSLREAVSDILEANRELTRTEFEGRDVVREPLAV
jgi:transcriptional regulator with XRE-family HTH domain